MKALILLTILFVATFTYPAFAATVGSPADMSVPEEGLLPRDEAIEMALDRYESYINVKMGFDVEIVAERELSTSFETTSPKIEGENYMLKFSNNILDVFEPYVKIGSSHLEAKWSQNGNDISVETETDFIWGAGVQAKLFEVKEYGVKLNLDAQYRSMDLDVDKCKVAGATIDVTDTWDRTFKVEEWQVALYLSKKCILPVGFKDLYIVPYAGLLYSNSEYDVSFIHDDSGGNDKSTSPIYSLYKAHDESPFGITIGFDVMPSLLSWYMLSFEIRMINEMAFSIGGTLKF